MLDESNSDCLSSVEPPSRRSLDALSAFKVELVLIALGLSSIAIQLQVFGLLP